MLRLQKAAGMPGCAGSTADKIVSQSFDPRSERRRSVGRAHSEGRRGRSVRAGMNAGNVSLTELSVARQPQRARALLGQARGRGCRCHARLNAAAGVVGLGGFTEAGEGQRRFPYLRHIRDSGAIQDVIEASGAKHDVG